MPFLSSGSGRQRIQGTASLTSVSGQVIKQITLKAISKHRKSKKVTGCSQHRFMEGKTRLIKSITFHSESSRTLDEGRTVMHFILTSAKT